MTVNGGRTHQSEQARLGVTQNEVPVAAQRRHEHSQHRAETLVGRTATERPHQHQRARQVGSVGRGAGTSRPHKLDRAGLGERVAGVVAVPTGQFDQRIEDRGLLELGGPLVGGGHLLRDGVALTHR